MKTLVAERNRTPAPGSVPPSVLPNSWQEFACLYPIYDALTKECALPPGPYPARLDENSWPVNRQRDLHWLDEVDRRTEAVHLRRLLATPAAAREQGLRLVLQRQLAKLQKQGSDRDKVDLLVVQYFVLCVQQDSLAGPVDAADVASVLRPVLGEIRPTPIDCCNALDRILSLAQHCRRLREFMEQGLLEQGRLVKEGIGEAFYEPVALVWIARFNFLLRRCFIQLLHEDLRASGLAVKELEARQVKFVDCRRAGFCSEESTVKLRQFIERWKPPLQSDYCRNAAFQPYEQLMSLREDLEEALNPAGTQDLSRVSGEAEPGIAAIEMKPEFALPAQPGVAAFADKPLAAAPAMFASATPKNQQAKPTRHVPLNSISGEEPSVLDSGSSSAESADIEGMEEKIWEQLIATPPARGRSMTTVTVDQARILLSAWEVAAFVSESGNDSDELRRVIVARGLLSTAIDRTKRQMDLSSLQGALAHARTEVPRFQERVEQLKRNSKTDGAVNLGISLKRLLSLVEEAEQLQKGKEGQAQKQ